MVILFSHPECVNYSQPGHPERPFRIKATVEYLKKHQRWSDRLEWRESKEAEAIDLRRAHLPSHIESVIQGGSGGAEFDADTPAYPSIDLHARRSAGSAIQAMQCALEGKTAMSLIRPPGHHATPSQAMGFCYFNSIAIAVLKAQADTDAKKIATLDFDVHHGNGTQDVLIGNPGVVFYSLHQSPCYPGTGLKSEKNCFNFPLPPQTPPRVYRETFTQALDAIQKWKPDLLAVSAGFDAFREDPLSDQLLELDDFEWFGSCIRDCGIPAFHVLEGGYSDRLPEVIASYLKGINPESE